MTAIQALRIFNRLWARYAPLAAMAQEADAGFDGGEWSGPLHGEAQDAEFERLLQLVAERTGVAARLIEAELHRAGWIEQQARGSATLAPRAPWQGFRVSRQQVEQGVLTLEPASAGALATYVAEASSLGLPPGPAPRRIGTDLGNGLAFELVDANDEVWIYRQACGCIDLHILND